MGRARWQRVGGKPRRLMDLDRRPCADRRLPRPNRRRPHRPARLGRRVLGLRRPALGLGTDRGRRLGVAGPRWQRLVVCPARLRFRRRLRVAVGARRDDDDEPARRPGRRPHRPPRLVRRLLRLPGVGLGRNHSGRLGMARPRRHRVGVRRLGGVVGGARRPGGLVPGHPRPHRVARLVRGLFRLSRMGLDPTRRRHLGMGGPQRSRVGPRRFRLVGAHRPRPRRLDPAGLRPFPGPTGIRRLPREPA